MKEIIKSINSKIKAEFPDIDIQSTDVTEGFSRPSFYVDFRDINKSRLNYDIENKKLTISILYFPTDRYKYRLEVLDVIGRLEEIFTSCTIETSKVKFNIIETEANIVDGILEFEFDIDYIARIKEQELPLIEELEITTEV